MNKELTKVWIKSLIDGVDTFELLIIIQPYFDAYPFELASQSFQKLISHQNTNIGNVNS